jgi:hypothetical protein
MAAPARRRLTPRPKQYSDQPMEGWIERPSPASEEIAPAVKHGRERLRVLHARTVSTAGTAADSKNTKPTTNGRYVRRVPRKKPNTRIVSPNPDGGWDVRKPGASRASAHLDRQSDADKRAAQILRNEGGGERITQGRNGKIRSKDTIAPGRDPYPPRDREH